MSMSFILTIWTVVAFLFFIGIVIWAWSGGRKKEFDMAANIALDDDKPLEITDKKQTKSGQE